MIALAAGEVATLLDSCRFILFENDRRVLEPGDQLRPRAGLLLGATEQLCKERRGLYRNDARWSAVPGVSRKKAGSTVRYRSRVSARAATRTVGPLDRRKASLTLPNSSTASRRAGERGYADARGTQVGRLLPEFRWPPARASEAGTCRPQMPVIDTTWSNGRLAAWVYAGEP